MTTRARLSLQRLRLPVRLGCEREERHFTQPVEVSFELEWSTPPHAGATDKLSDTLCYAEISERFAAVAGAREYALIETLAHALSQELARYCVERPQASGDLARWHLSVHKLQPPVDALLGGVQYALEGDCDEAWRGPS